MIRLPSTAFVRIPELATFLFLCVSFNVGRGQSVDQILAKCRASIENLTSYEYIAHYTGNFAHNFAVERRFFFARQGDAYRCDQKFELPEQGGILPAGLFWRQGSADFRAGFDGLYYFQYDKINQLERLCSSPRCMEQVVEPFQDCFFWLTRTNSRSELLRESRWDSFAKSCDDFVSKQLIESHSCLIITSGPKIEGGRWEVAFGEDVGYLPVRVRNLSGDKRKPVGELLVSQYKHYRIDGVSFYFPSKFTSRSLVEGNPNTYVATLEPGTVNINRPIPSDLLRLTYDPVWFDK